jgi:Domain of unknown function (DUF4124)
MPTMNGFWRTDNVMAWNRNTVQGRTRAGTWVGLLLAVCAGNASAQAIFTCIDGKGRRLTSDRPIPECLDREQKELNPSGTVRRNVGPNLTATERATQEAKEKDAAEERARLAEEKRRDRALLIRYPSKVVHDRERAEALGQVDEVIKAANKRVTELAAQRESMNAEFDFYKKDPSRAPPSLKRQAEDIEQSTAVQKRFITDQDNEKRRINARFDEELVTLRKLWALGAPVAAPASAAGSSAKR